jgi:hypothetical protein
MNSPHQSADMSVSTAHLVVAWLGNLAAFLLGQGSPLQGLVLLATLVFTVLQTYILVRDKLRRRRGQSGE